MKSFVVALILLFSASAHAADTTFAMTTTAFLDEGVLPVLYTCDGKDLSPAFTWTNPPAGTEAYALIFVDQNTASPFYHWVIYNIPKTTTSLPQDLNKLPEGAVVAKNSFGKNQYNGPCPPKGSSHTYIFTLYALKTKLTIPKDADAKTVIEAAQQNAIGQTKLTTVYSRWF